MYKSRFSFFYVYLSLALALILFCAGLYFFIHPEIIIKSKSAQSNAAAFAGFIFFLIALIIAYPIIKRAARIILTDDSVQLRYITRTILINTSQIDSIQLNARKSSGFFSADYKLMGINIVLKEGKRYFLFDIYFSERAIAKQHIETFCSYPSKIKLIDPIKTSSTKSKNISVEEEKFSGSYLLSYNFMLLIILLASFSIPLFISKNSIPVFAAAFVGFYMALWFLLGSRQANYFIISGDALLVRNHLFFWEKKIHEISSVRQVFFVDRYRASNSLLIIFTDYSSKRYFAGSLRKKHWLALKEKFEALGIPVESDFFLT